MTRNHIPLCVVNFGMQFTMTLGEANVDSALETGMNRLPANINLWRSMAMLRTSLGFFCLSYFIYKYVVLYVRLSLSRLSLPSFLKAKLCDCDQTGDEGSCEQLCNRLVFQGRLCAPKHWLINYWLNMSLMYLQCIHV